MNARISQPRLDFLAHFRVELAPPQDLGDTPWGHRRIIGITGGEFRGDRFSGDVLPGGADWQVIHEDGTTTVDTRYTLRTNDDALVHIRTSGKRAGSPEVLAALAAGEDVDPAEYYFRVTASFETGEPAYAWLNRTVVVGAAARSANAVEYDAYVVT
jgi:hypothetical protein